MTPTSETPSQTPTPSVTPTPSLPSEYLKIIMGGLFQNFNGKLRNRLVQLDEIGNEDVSFYTNLGTAFNGQVNTTNRQSDGKILVGGNFLELNGNARNRMTRLNSDGTEDTAFYTNMGTAFNQTVNSIKEQSDGKILVGGNFVTFNGASRVRLLRLNSDGTEDSAFYTNIGTGFDVAVNHVNQQSDGKILVGGSYITFNGNTRNRLVRLNSDGTEDTAFYTNMGTAFDGLINDTFIQSDGKILVGGNYSTFNGNTTNDLVRLNSDGTEDTAFTTNLGTGCTGQVYVVKVQSDGKILVGGSMSQFNGNIRNGLIRLNSDGTEDTSFYTNLGSGFTNTSVVFDVEIQSDGKILVGASFTLLNGVSRLYAVRLNSDGTLDTAFYSNMGTSFDNTIRTILIHSNTVPPVTPTPTPSITPSLSPTPSVTPTSGLPPTPTPTPSTTPGVPQSINIGGTFTTFNGNTRNRMFQLNNDGTEDTAFYANMGTGFSSSVNAIVTQPDTKIIVAGAFTGFNSNVRRRLVRLNSDGTEDTAFYTNLGSGITSGDVATVCLQSDGKIVIGGASFTFNGNTRNRIFRLNSDGTEDTAFYTNLGGFPNNTVNIIVQQSDGKLLVGGVFTQFPSGITRNRLVRLNSDGTEDSAFYTNMGTAFGGLINDIRIQSDGKIVVVGGFTTFNGNTRNRILRLNSDGTEDTAFYTNLGSGFGTTPSDLAIQSDGKILVGGSFTTFNGNARNRLLRLNSDGTEDTAFYTNMGTAFNSQISNVQVQNDGKIVLVGVFTTFNALTRNRLVRLNSDGTEDTAFYTNLGTGVSGNPSVISFS